MTLAVIVPMLNEAPSIECALASARGANERIVVDGGSSDGGCDIALAMGATVLRSERGRGRQLDLGVRQSVSDFLLFLHADTQLPPDFRALIEESLCRSNAEWGRFDVRFDEGGRLLRLIAWLISMRSRLSRVATGDQAIFVSRTALAQVGGIREPDLFEDIDLCRRLKRYGPMAVPRQAVVTSARRWRKAGIWRTTLKMWLLKTLYLCGVRGAVLRRFYENVR
jgi:rSAM/selenodomain-associated transferase 2